MICQNCHKPNVSSAIFCEHCGAKILQISNYSNPSQPDIITIGRAPQNNIVISNGDVSSNHCRIYRTEKGAVIEDLNSTNGTFVNGRRVNKEYIKQNDVISVANTRLNLNDIAFQKIFGTISNYSSGSRTNISIGNSSPGQNSSTFNVMSWLSGGGAIIVLICFFLPWIEFSCSGVKESLSGADIGGIYWLIFLLSLIALILFLTFTGIKQAKKAAPYIIISSIISLGIMIWKIIEFYQGEDVGYGLGKIKPSEIGLSLKAGIYGTIIGLIVTLIGAFFLKNENDNIDNRK